MDSLVSTEWLARESGAEDLRIVDASKHPFEPDRQPRVEFEAGHIPGALFLDLGSLVDESSSVPNTVPQAKKFSARMRDLGIGHSDRVVLYDHASQVKSATRAWFLCQHFGLENVGILDGGFAKWKSEGREIASGAQNRDTSDFIPTKGREIRRKYELLANIDSRAEQVVDARPPERFEGNTPEPREGMEAGHIPGAVNLPIGWLYEDNGTFKDEAGLRAAFNQAGVDMDRPLVTSCGSGMTASTLLFAAHLIGKDDVSLYDGSWAEWGADPALPKETGPAR